MTSVMKTALAAACVMALCAGTAQAASQKLMVLSVDGLDWRYLRDRDALGSQRGIESRRAIHPRSTRQHVAAGSDRSCRREGLACQQEFHRRPLD